MSIWIFFTGESSFSLETLYDYLFIFKFIVFAFLKILLSCVSNCCFFFYGFLCWFVQITTLFGDKVASWAFISSKMLRSLLPELIWSYFVFLMGSKMTLLLLYLSIPYFGGSNPLSIQSAIATDYPLFFLFFYILLLLIINLKIKILLLRVIWFEKLFIKLEI